MTKGSIRTEAAKLLARKNFLTSSLKRLHAGSEAHEELSAQINSLQQDIDVLKALSKTAGEPLSAKEMKDEASWIIKEARAKARVKRKDPPKVIKQDWGEAGEAAVDEQRLLVDFEYFCRTCIKIKYRPGMNPDMPTGGKGPFILNENQKRLTAVFYQVMLIEKKPLRVQILKSRQLGNTTFLLAFALWMSLKTEAYHVMMIIDKNSHNRTKRSMVIEWIDHITGRDDSDFTGFDVFNHCYIKRGGRGENQVDLGNGSIWFFESAESTNPGTSEMLHFLIESEKPKWPAGRADTIRTSILPGIPHVAFTAHIDESTAHGVGPFKRKWSRNTSAAPGTSEVIPIFFPWMISKEYAVTPPSECFDKDGKFIYADSDDEVRDFDNDIDSEIVESEYAKKYKLDIRQVYFRRLKIKEDYEGNRADFDQEYPTTPDHAFRLYQSQFFPNRLNNHIKDNSNTVDSPYSRGYLEDLEGNTEVTTPVPYSMVKPAFHLNRRGDYYVRFRPVFGKIYFIGADTAEGKTVLDEKGRDDPDYTVFTVKDDHGTTCAYYIARDRPEHAWLPLLLMARWYNNAWVNGEKNNTGLTLFAMWWLTGYPNNIVQSKPKTAPVRDRAWTTTGKANRGPMLRSLRSVLYSDFGRVFCLTLDGGETPLKQFPNFVINARSGKAEASSGFHDDIILSEAIAEDGRKWYFGDAYTTGTVTAPLEKKEKSSTKWAHEVAESNGGYFTLEDTDLYT